MMVLRPYIAWMDMLRGLSRAVGGQTAHMTTYPVFEMRNQADFYQSYKAQATSELKALMKAKRFVIPGDFPTQTSNDSEDYRLLARANPHLPFKTMYLQMPFSLLPVRLADKDISRKTYLCVLLEEVENKEGAAWIMHLTTYRRLGGGKPALGYFPARLTHLIKGSFLVGPGEHRLDEPLKHTIVCHSGFGVTDEQESETVWEEALLVVLEIIDRINNQTVEVVEQQGMRIIPKKVKSSAKIEHNIIKLGTPQHSYPEGPCVASLEEAIRMRQHDVRGHWRHLPSERMVWVRSHKRGDPALGVLDSEYDL